MDLVGDPSLRHRQREVSPHEIVVDCQKSETWWVYCVQAWWEMVELSHLLRGHNAMQVAVDARSQKICQ